MSRSPAWDLEVLKLRRSSVARTAALVLVLGTTSMAAVFTAVGLAGGDSQMALKVRPMLQGEGWVAYLGLLAQVLSVAMLLCAGVVVSWSVGREFADGTIACLLALPTPPRAVLVAKLGSVLLGAAASTVAAVALALPLGALAGLGPPGAEAVGPALRAVAVGLLGAVLVLPLAFVASARRGYLPGVGALLGVVVVTQVATVAGAGAWFPWAAPGLWAGMGGAAAAGAVTPLQLLLALPVGAAGAVAAARWWSRAELR
ncbi:ABC transporter permease [Actinotalea solisilvae]|uniref:ABC transporter permease n=1 Tax=Actinotalea solisilvae TaxID=2072922 RepID=UPI0018F1EC28|nr:ABC transporter permease [Actinotalea solisilvae]